VTKAALSGSAQRVQDAIAARGFDYRVFELEVPVRTAADAAKAVGCEVGQIAKSLIFRGGESGKSVLVITSGMNRVNEARVAGHLGEALARAEPDFVKRVTGYAIGGIPPLGHAESSATFIDEDLLTFERIWAAAGHPNALFELRPGDLVAMTGGTVTGVK
jgi:prolyl-tRNA editing enzyme YbaK/EbsC (Cys-tRNA(Pro) deacylase)